VGSLEAPTTAKYGAVKKPRAAASDVPMANVVIALKFNFRNGLCVVEGNIEIEPRLRWGITMIPSLLRIR
jgi:hypothetical protein